MQPNPLPAIVLIPIIAGALGLGAGAWGYHALTSSGGMSEEEQERLRLQREAEQHAGQLRINLMTEQIAPFAIAGILAAGGVGAYLLWKSRQEA